MSAEKTIISKRFVMTPDQEAKRQREAAKLKRRAQQLRENLSRRKVQTRARREGEADGRDDGLPAARHTEGQE